MFFFCADFYSKYSAFSSSIRNFFFSENVRRALSAHLLHQTEQTWIRPKNKCTDRNRNRRYERKIITFHLRCVHANELYNQSQSRKSETLNGEPKKSRFFPMAKRPCKIKCSAHATAMYKSEQQHRNVQIPNQTKTAVLYCIYDCMAKTKNVVFGYLLATTTKKALYRSAASLCQPRALIFVLCSLLCCFHLSCSIVDIFIPCPVHHAICLSEQIKWLRKRARAHIVHTQHTHTILTAHNTHITHEHVRRTLYIVHCTDWARKHHCRLADRWSQQSEKKGIQTLVLCTVEIFRI